MRHLQSASHLGRLDELVEILCDDGSRGNSIISQNSWNSTRDLSPDIIDVREQALEYDSILSSVLDYPISRDTDLVRFDVLLFSWYRKCLLYCSSLCLKFV